MVHQYIRGRPSNWDAIEKEYDKPMKQILIDLYEELGSQAAIAERFEVSQSTISLWMRICGLRIQTISHLVEIDN